MVNAGARRIAFRKFLRVNGQIKPTNAAIQNISKCTIVLHEIYAEHIKADREAQL